MADFPSENPVPSSSTSPSAPRKRKTSTRTTSLPFPRHRLGSTSSVNGRLSLTTSLLTDLDSSANSPMTEGLHSSSPEIVAPTPRRHLLSAHQSRLWLSQDPPSPTSSRGISPTSTIFSQSPAYVEGLPISSVVSRRLNHQRSSSPLATRAMSATPPLAGLPDPAAIAATRTRSSYKLKQMVRHSEEDALGRRWIRWMHKRGMKDWVSIAILLVGVLLRFCIGLSSYSGRSQPPMYGDYEAQRHWMEITIHLPLREWYTYDLQYWGLDYPPLTAFHSWICGKIGSWIEPSWFALDASRGFESNSSKLFMRSTVVVSDLLVYVPALVLFQRTWLATRSKRTQEFAFIALLLHPALLLIDFGHFQYNSVMLGFTILALDFFASGHDLLGAIFFVLSLGFKQMALYYAPAVGSYLLAKCLSLGSVNGSKLFIRLGIITSVTFVILFSPFLPPFAPLSTVLHPITRIFPFNRGLFEDKVANFWCASNVIIKWKNWAAPSFLVKTSTALTLLGFLPSVFVMLQSGMKLQLSAESLGEPHPLLPLLPYTLLNSSMSFFLFSFQVHEKTILLPLMPLLLLFSGAAQESTVFTLGALVTNVAVFSMWPLLKRDGLGLQYLALLLLWNRIIGHNPLRFPTKNFLHFVSLSVYSAAIILHLLEMVITPPQRYPDLFPVLNVLVSTPVFVLTWLWSIKGCVEMSWAIGGLGSSRSSESMTNVGGDGSIKDLQRARTVSTMSRSDKDK